MNARKPLDALALSTMLALCLLWGMQQVAVKLAAHGMSSIMQIGLRSAIAALLVCALMLVRRQRFSFRDGLLLPGLGAGALFALEFLLVAIGLQYTTASHMSVFLYTAPVFTVLGLHFLVPGERLGRVQWAGVIAAFAGIAVAFSEGLSAPGADWMRMLAGDALGVLSGLFWAATTLVVRRTALAEAPPATTLLYQLTACGVILPLVGVLAGQAVHIEMTPVVWGSLIFQSVFVAFLSFLVWFWLLQRYLASRLSVFSFLTPLFGVGFGVMLLDDPLDSRFLAGALLVMAGVILVNFKRG